MIPSGRATRTWRRWHGLVLAAVLAGHGAAVPAARNPPSTVGKIAESNGLRANGWLRVRTTSILRVETGERIEGDARRAIAAYDELLVLPPTAMDPSTRAEALRRSADLRVQLADEAQAGGTDLPVAEVRQAITHYERLLQDYPAHATADRALYQLARAHAMLEHDEAAITALSQLGVAYPQSARAADAGFRAGEMLFMRKRYPQAEQAYAGLLALGPTAPYFELAQYKYGWTLYKQSQFERAAAVFLAILERDLPAGELDDATTALAAVAADKAERATESLRMLSLSFAALGGGPAFNAFLARTPNPAQVARMESLIQSELGRTLLEQERYTEAAGTYLAFVERHPSHRRAPDFQGSAITAYEAGGFAALALAAQETYAERYAPDAAYWQQREPDQAVLAEVRRRHDVLSRHYQALAQPLADSPARRAGYLNAARWYQRTLERFPDDPDHVATSLLLADALLEGGRPEQAAEQYAHTAYALPAHARSGEAALAAVQAWQQTAERSTQGAALDAARQQTVAASLKLAEVFPAHPQRDAVLMVAAEGQFGAGQFDDAVRTAQTVLDGQPSLPLRRSSLNLIADVHFSRGQYAQAEATYLELGRIDRAAGNDRLLVERLAASIYKQGEDAQRDGDLTAAAQHYARVGELAPAASIRAAADYDAASAWVALQDWPNAVAALENFRRRHPQQALLPDVDKKLALAYESAGQASAAAAVHERIAARPTEAAEIRRQASWSAAHLYEQAGLPAQTLRAYRQYVEQYPQPLEPAMQARSRLADLALSLQRDHAVHRYWLQQMVLAGPPSGQGREDPAQRLAAEANLALGRLQADEAARLALRAPLENTLAARRGATEESVRTLERAAAYGYADITSAATFELATVYAEFGAALLRSEPPRQLAGDALEQYTILLEEQAFPFEEKAIRAHEINLARLQHGTWNDAIGKSVAALGALSPAKYGKHEKREIRYEELH